MSLFVKAQRRQARLRLGIIGPSGSGKTMTSLRVAKGLAGDGKVAVIDTEHGSASLYSDKAEFDVCNLDSFEVERYVAAINEADAAGYSVIIIDSLSHAWAGKGGILEFVDKAGKRGGGNNFSAWRDATPRHNQLIETILGCRCHVIATLRSKVEHVIETVNGRTQVRKVGLQPVQRDGMEYEFTICGDMTDQHELIITKTRAAFLKDEIIREPGESFGERLAEWLNSGEPARIENPISGDKLVADTLPLISKATEKACSSLRGKIVARHTAGEITDQQKELLITAIEHRLAHFNEVTA